MDIYTVSSVLFRLFRRLYQVRDIKLDMTPNMEQIVRSCFPTANELLTVSGDFSSTKKDEANAPS